MFLPGSDSSNNMSGGVYVIGWLLTAMAIRFWPIQIWWTLWILIGMVTLVGTIWTFDTFRRLRWPMKRIVTVMGGIPLAIMLAILLMPVANQ